MSAGAGLREGKYREGHLSEDDDYFTTGDPDRNLVPIH